MNRGEIRNVRRFMTPRRTWLLFDLIAVILAASFLVECGPSSSCDPCSLAGSGSARTLGETATAVGMYAGVAVPADLSDPRMEIVPLHFNSVTAENAMKWGELARELGSYDFTAADALVDFAEAHALRLRGHTLVWGPSPDQGYPADLPAKIREAEDPEAFTLDAIRTHVSTVVGRYAGRVESWDVVNEPLAMVGSGFDPNIFYEVTGTSYIAEAFHAARETDPDARLFLNEYFQSYGGPKARAFVDLLAGLLEQGVPIDGAGIQGHVYVAAPRPWMLKSFLTKLADLGLQIEFTELDILKLAMLGRLQRGLDLHEAQADVYRDITEACVETPACRGITVWGIDDGHTWFDQISPFNLFAPNEPLLLDRSREPKPAYDAVRRAIASRDRIR